MKFKAGDRVHVKKLDWEDVDFFATLEETATDGVFSLIDCSLKEYSGRAVIAPHRGGFGSEDYYTLATDEEDTEPVEVQHTNDSVNHPSHYNFGDIEVIDFAEQVASQYPPKLAPHVYNAIKYLSRATLKNGQEDIEKAKFSVQRLFDKWE